MTLAATDPRPTAHHGRLSSTSAIEPLKRWDLATPDFEAARELARHLKLSQTLAGIMTSRGHSADDLDAARRFLTPSLGDLDDPATIPGLDDAAIELADAIKAGKKIIIYGDYDVDGITASAILWHAFTTLGADEDHVECYVPHRIDEGYGLNGDALKQLADDGADVVVTVDCAITACDEAKLAKDLGITLIITDHHEWRTDDAGEPIIPDADHVVHPRLPSAKCNPELVGAGVAFKLAWQVGKHHAGGPKVGDAMKRFLIDALALAALGTVADVAPLQGENRIIVRFGLGGLTKSRLPGVRALIDASGLGGRDLDSIDVGFKLGPRLNACGRMGHAREAVEMFTAATPGRARDIALDLEEKNKERQKVERQIVKAAEQEVIENGWNESDCPAIVVAGDGWHPGVVGIVASRLVDKFHRPTIVLGLDENTAAGSGRSIDGFNLAETLQTCTDLLISHGGHAMAAGVKLDALHLEVFRERFTQAAREQLQSSDLVARLRCDAEISPQHVSESLARDLARLSPCGRGNPTPIIVLRGLDVISARSCGKNDDHLQLRFADGHGGFIKSIAFGRGDLATQIAPGARLDVAAELSLNEWNGRVSAELMIRDLMTS
jgi:single-stranded-DNA-specific exonuclease